MLTGNLPALTRNIVLVGILCIALNGNFGAWFLLLFLGFVEMDEELAKFEIYADFHASQIELYDFSKASTQGGNLEEQLRIFNQQHPEVVQQYQRTFHTRIQELRKQPTTKELRKKQKNQSLNSKSKKQELKLKQEVFGYTENYGDEQERDGTPTNEFVEIMDHISANSMYEGYHQNGLVIPESEYGIKTMCLYHDKYREESEDKQTKIIDQQHHSYIYEHLAPMRYEYKNKGLYYRTPLVDEATPPKVNNNLLYGHMSDYQRAKYNQPPITKKQIHEYKDIRINYTKHLQYLANKSPTTGQADLTEIAKVQSVILKHPPGEMWIKIYNKRRKRYYMHKISIK